MTDWNQQIIEEFRANDGKVGGHFEGATLVLMHAIGAKSGKERITPVMTIEDGEKFIIIASKGGAPTNPAWYYNLVANPEIEVEYGTDQFKVRAKVTSEPERSQLYAKMGAQHPFFLEYQEKTERIIPVLTLERLNY